MKKKKKVRKAKTSKEVMKGESEDVSEADYIQDAHQGDNAKEIDYYGKTEVEESDDNE